MATENCSSARDLLRFLPSACRNRRVIRSKANPPPIRKLLVGKRRRIEKPQTAIISNLSDDLLVEILIRVPEPRSACWCRAVCKQWNALLSGPYFLRRFVSRHQSLWATGGEPPLLHSDNLRDSISRFLPLPADGELGKCFRVRDSFKDLFLCGFSCRTDENAEFCRSFLVCNLFTKLWLALPLAPERPIKYARLVVARLVCEPRSSSSNFNFNLGDGQAFLYSEYRFRVVCMYQIDETLALDMFCSESGEWTENALVLDGHCRLIQRNVVSCNGELFWACRNPKVVEWNASIVKFNPFHLDRPPAFLRSRALGKWYKPWNIFVSQGALHIVLPKAETLSDGRYVFHVFRLQEDPKACRRIYTYTLHTSEHSETKMHVDKFSVADMHPESPELIFLKVHYHHGAPAAYFCCNTTSRELTFIAKEGQLAPRWVVFQPRASCWPTPIPRYEELRGVYNGSYSCLVQQSSIKATIPLVTKNCSIIGQFGHGRKDKRSALRRHCRRRFKEKLVKFRDPRRMLMPLDEYYL